jgi:hypothetical protein
MLRPSQAPFHGIVPGAAAAPDGYIALPVTFETRENFRMETIQFEVTSFETAYTTFFGTADALQIHGNPLLCLLGLENARATWCHLHQRGR